MSNYKGKILQCPGTIKLSRPKYHFEILHFEQAALISLLLLVTVLRYMYTFSFFPKRMIICFYCCFLFFELFSITLHCWHKVIWTTLQTVVNHTYKSNNNSHLPEIDAIYLYLTLTATINRTYSINLLLNFSYTEKKLANWLFSHIACVLFNINDCSFNILFL